MPPSVPAAIQIPSVVPICTRSFGSLPANAADTANKIKKYRLPNNSPHRNFFLFIFFPAINPPAMNSFDRTPDKYSSVKKALLELPILGTFLYNVRTHESNIRRTLQKTYFSRPQLVSSKMLDAYYEASHMGKSHGKYLMASIEGHYTDNAIGHAVKKLTIPLYIIESRSMTDAVAIADSYAHKNATVETAYISNAGLTPQLEVPDKLLNIMRMFLHEDH